MALFPKIRKGWLIAVVAVIILASLNPTYTDFKEFTGLAGTQSKHLHKKANLLICSIYENDLADKKYLGVLKNFIDVTPKSDVATGRDSLDSASINSVNAEDLIDTTTTLTQVDEYGIPIKKKK